MKILIIWAESINRYTGGSSHFWGLMRGIKSIGWGVRTIAPRYGRAEVTRHKDVSFIPLPPRSIISFTLLQILTVLCLPYWLVKHRPEVIYVRTCFLSFLIYPICRLSGVLLIAEVDAIVEEEIRMRGQRRILAHTLRIFNKLNYRWVDGMVCVTSGIREELIRRGANLETTIVIHNAAETSIMYPMNQKDARRQFGLDEHVYIVGFAGTFSSWQGLDLLIQAAKQVLENSDRPVQFVLVGEGQCRQELQEMVDKLQLGRSVSFLAPVPFEQVAVFNNACDVIVIPIHDRRKLRYGISPLKFWDAVSVGVPVLVPEGSQLENVLAKLRLPGTFRAGDTEDLSEQILQFLPNTEHHQSRRKDVHQIVSQEYSWTKAAERLIEHSQRLKRMRL
jgi:glycosyltransferase involved in cell wall biosynthesis